MQNIKTPFHKFIISGDDKSSLIDAMDFLMKRISAPINSFMIDPKGYLVFCHTYMRRDGSRSQNNFNTTLYPFQPTAVVLSEHIYQYLNNLTTPQKEAMGAIIDSSAEYCECGWELFSPNEHSDDYSITDDRDEATPIAVKPIIIEYGK